MHKSYKNFLNGESKLIDMFLCFPELHQHLKELFEATVRRHLSNNNTEIELIEMDCIVQVSGLRGYDEEALIMLRINEIRLDPLKLVVSGVKSCPVGESPHRLPSIDYPVK